MTYELHFLEEALKEWKKLDASIRGQFRAKLKERLETPHVPASRLRGSSNRYKIKLRSLGYRLVYAVDDDIITVTVIAVGKRDRGAVYEQAQRRAG
jgi:mRNA interferase RelE/StbE